MLTDQLVLTVGYDIESLIGSGDQERTIAASCHNRLVWTLRSKIGARIDQTLAGKPPLRGCFWLRSQSYTNASSTKTSWCRRSQHRGESRCRREQPRKRKAACEQLDLFTDYSAVQQQEESEEAALAREKQIQTTLLGIKKKHGRNAILKGMNLEDGATTVDRNRQIGGHRA